MNHKQKILLDDLIQKDLWELGIQISKKFDCPNPCENNSSYFRNSVFQLNAFNWFSEEASGHDYNFKYKNFYISWYKYLGRSSFQSQKMTHTAWSNIYQECLNSII